MLSLPEIKKFYSESLHGFDSFLLREYLQHKILEIIFESPFGQKLTFIGGTCLRIVHNNNRFSEDLDFDNFGLTQNEFEQIADLISENLKNEGYEVEIRNVFRNAFHCHVKFPRLLYEAGVSGFPEEKINIRIDTEAQGFDHLPQSYILNKFDVFTNIRATPLDILLSQKFTAVLNRPRNKGRDFFDIVFLLPQVKPNYDFLNFKFGFSNSSDLKKVLLEKCDTIDFEEMSKDVQPFLFHESDIKRVKLFKEYLKQVEL